MAFIKVTIDGLAMDMVSNSPVVVLKGADNEKVLPIWIGHSEAWAIAMEISGVGAKRPLTHDLFRIALEAVGCHLEKVEITDLKEQTFYARLYIKKGDEIIDIDARPSDSIALALKSKCPIYVNEELFDIKKEDIPENMPDMNNPESLAERLKKIDPEDFGKYSL